MKVHTVLQRVYKRQWDNTYQEYILHLINFEDDIGNKTIRHDKTIVGGIWKEAKDGEVGVFGETMFFDQKENKEKRLILIKRAATD